MHSADAQELARRVACLEHRLAVAEAGLREATRRGRGTTWRAVAMSAAGLWAGFAFLAADVPLNFGTPKGHLVAPFTVFDDANKPIMTVGEWGANRGVVLFDSAGAQRLDLDTGTHAGLRAHAAQGGKEVLFLGLAASDGGGVLSLSNSAGSLSSVLSRDSGGKAGLLSVLRPGAGSAAQLGDMGAVVMNPSGTPVARLSGTSASGKASGYLVLANGAGAALVEAGTISDRFGVVRTYPLGGPPPIPIPNFLVGHGFVQASGGG